MPRPSEDSELQARRLEMFGGRLRQLRTWRGWSQSAVAGRAGISRDFLAKVEQGRVSPGLLRVWEIADALEVTPAELFFEGLPASWAADQRKRPTPP